MLLRYIELRSTIDKFTSEYAPAQMFKLKADEWLHLTYLVDVARHFSFWTTNIGASKGARIGYLLGAYDELFEALEECRRRLRGLREEYTWTIELVSGIDAALKKLEKYYALTYSDIGSFYALGAILSPRIKMQAFALKYSWLFDPTRLKDNFEFEFRNLYREYYAQREPINYTQQQEIDLDPMSLVFGQRRGQIHSQSRELDFDEIDRYLSLGILYPYSNHYSNRLYYLRYF